ncbi:MAG TPA: hypothetical protein VGM88_13240 [Kofleriaceae bacterium]|jgi:hypothetical protein
MLRWILWAALGCAACRPVSLGAVKATAGIGSSLGGFADAFDREVIYCQTEPSPACATLEKDVATWRVVNGVLVGYAAALSAMADDSSDKDQTQAVATAIAALGATDPTWKAALNDNVSAGVSDGTNKLIAGIIGVYRRERLSSTIEASAAPLDDVVEKLVREIGVMDQLDGVLLDRIAETRAALGAEHADKRAFEITLTLARADVAAHRARLGEYKAAALAFAKAHDVLRKGLKGLGDKKADLELLKQISNTVSAIAKDKTLAEKPVQ